MKMVCTTSKKWMSLVLIPIVDVGQDRVTQLLCGVEASVGQALALQDAEEQLYLIDPGGVFGRVVKDEAIAMALVEPAPSSIGPVVMDIEVVPNDVYGPGRVPGGEFVHEPHQIVPGAPIPTASEHIAAVNLE